MVDTTGAGDAYAAGFLAGLTAGKGLNAVRPDGQHRGRRGDQPLRREARGGFAEADARRLIRGRTVRGRSCLLLRAARQACVHAGQRKTSIGRVCRVVGTPLTSPRTNKGSTRMATTTFKLGDMIVHRIIEMECGFTPALEFLPKLTPEMLDESRPWMQNPMALDDQDRLVLCFQSYIVRTGRHVILVDSCVGNNKDRPARPIWHMKNDNVFMQGLAEVGLTVNDIDFVLCTHLHVDHVGWNTRLENGRWVPTFPKARYLFSKTELDFWLAENDKTTVPPIADSVIPIVEAKRHDLVTSDHAVSDLVRLIPTPGHTIDHYAVTLGTDRQGRGDHRGPDPYAVAGKMARSGDADRLRSAAKLRHAVEIPGVGVRH